MYFCKRFKKKTYNNYNGHLFFFAQKDETALHIAAANNHLEFLLHLIDLGADVNKQTKVRILLSKSSYRTAF